MIRMRRGRWSIRICHEIIGKLTGKSVNSEKKSTSVIQIDLAIARSIFQNLGRFFPELTSLPVNFPIKLIFVNEQFIIFTEINLRESAFIAYFAN